MERTLLLVRHAKSDWNNPGQQDYDRPLNARGQRDAPEMGARLKTMGIMPDLIIASTANRAAATARLIAAALGYAEDRIRWEDKLYHAPPSVFEAVMASGIDSSVKTLMMVAHNPGITDFANQITEKFSIDNMPTCSIVAVKAITPDWESFTSAGPGLLFFDYPKNK
ncbi:SixA phosphatase family protein [Taibaiella chishuiensis]|uniref:Phosphohistidine phosphatase n=1 Tax=Taibaiella chishuiensis TaxID=1434707 RepID=A0A2P8DBQ3_9BACT|nr:histidine phosphatase family protein [Taibaiella chishuiensis]PSK94646.1 phosphohistidine phosphatase [Taibaiella chishuiensis]